VAGGDDKAVALLDRVTEINSRRGECLASSGIDLLNLGDDIGMQQAMMMSLDFWMEWLQPRLKRLIARARAAAPGKLLILYHTCGFAEPAIPGLIDAGVDILNPVQPECMDFAKIHAQYGDRLSFDGTIGTQTTMPFGTPKQVEEAVRRNLDIAGEKGGLMPAPTHLVEPEVPWENVEAFVRACREYR
jgi:uroporphyrinogen decarboxylase